MIVVLGVLAAVIVPNVTKFTPTALKGAAQSEMATTQKAIYSAMADKGIGTITPDQTVKAGSDISPPIASFLQGGIDKLQGEWTVRDTGGIIYGKYKTGLSSGYWEYKVEPGSPLWTWK